MFNAHDLEENLTLLKGIKENLSKWKDIFFIPGWEILRLKLTHFH